MPAPVIKCSLTIEKVNPKTSTFTTKESLKNVTLSLSRNEWREVLLTVDAGKDNVRQRNFRIRQEEMTVHRKFVKEGKVTVASGAATYEFTFEN